MSFEEQLYRELKTLVEEFLRGDITEQEYEEIRICIMEDLEDIRDANI